MIHPYAIGIKEYTFEANPESLSKEKINILKKYGVNRISLGVESTKDKVLNSLNRHHTFDDVKRCVDDLNSEGVSNYSFDLILGCPNSTLKTIKEDIENILSLNPKHISCYSLEIHKNTVLYNRGVKQKSDELIRKYYDYISTRLKKENFIHYEVSNWAKEGFRSKHNITYWKNEEYYGIGLSAASYVNGRRNKNTRNLAKYLKNIYNDESIVISKEMDLNYYIMLSLRTNTGLSLSLIKKKYNIDLLKVKKEEIELNINNKFLLFDGNNLYPSESGMMVLDSIILSMLL